MVARSYRVAIREENGSLGMSKDEELRLVDIEKLQPGVGGVLALHLARLDHGRSASLAVFFGGRLHGDPRLKEARGHHGTRDAAGVGQGLSLSRKAGASLRRTSTLLWSENPNSIGLCAAGKVKDGCVPRNTPASEVADDKWIFLAPREVLQTFAMDAPIFDQDGGLLHAAKGGPSMCLLRNTREMLDRSGAGDGGWLGGVPGCDLPLLASHLAPLEIVRDAQAGAFSAPVRRSLDATNVAESAVASSTVAATTAATPDETGPAPPPAAVGKRRSRV